MKQNIINSRFDKLLFAFSIGIITFLIYIGFLSRMYNYDGVACAMAVELGRMKNLFHGNHLIYGFLGYLFYWVLRIFLGFTGTALISLQILNCLMGSASVLLFFMLMEKIGKNVKDAVFWALFLAFSYGYWLWSMEAQVYFLGIFFVLLLVILIFWYKDVSSLHNGLPKSAFFILALCHGMAVLSHISHIIFIPVVCVSLWQYKGDRKKIFKNIIFYLFVLGLFCSLFYLFVITIVFRLFNIRSIYLWFLGNALDISTNSLKWHGQFTFENLGKIMVTLENTIWVNLKKVSFIKELMPYQITKGSVLISKIFLYGCFFCLFLRFKKIYQKNKFIINICFVWLVCYGLFFSTWEPGTMVYRIPELVPVYLLAYVSFSSISFNKKLKVFCLSVYLVTLFFSNFCGGIYPYSLKINNIHLARAYFVKKNTTDNDFVIISGKGLFPKGKVYIPYFAQRQTLILNRYKGKNLALLRGIIFNKITKGGGVYFLSDVSDCNIGGLLNNEYKLIFCAADKKLSLFKIEKVKKDG